jgi:hypothetical protein
VIEFAYARPCSVTKAPALKTDARFQLRPSPWLNDEIDGWVAAGLTNIVSLLEDHGIRGSPARRRRRARRGWVSSALQFPMGRVPARSRPSRTERSFPVALPFSASAVEKSTAIVDDVAYTKPQELVAVESGRRLNIYCAGRGSPTIVFDSGLGDGAAIWGLIQPAVAKHTRACSYDRAGLGFSDPPTRPSTSTEV